jgi:hypothetical protein
MGRKVTLLLYFCGKKEGNNGLFQTQIYIFKRQTKYQKNQKKIVSSFYEIKNNIIIIIILIIIKNLLIEFEIKIKSKVKRNIKKRTAPT